LPFKRLEARQSPAESNPTSLSLSATSTRFSKAGIQPPAEPDLAQISDAKSQYRNHVVQPHTAFRGRQEVWPTAYRHVDLSVL